MVVEWLWGGCGVVVGGCGVVVYFEGVGVALVVVAEEGGGGEGMKE